MTKYKVTFQRTQESEIIEKDLNIFDFIGVFMDEHLPKLRAIYPNTRYARRNNQVFLTFEETTFLYLTVDIIELHENQTTLAPREPIIESCSRHWSGVIIDG